MLAFWCTVFLEQHSDVVFVKGTDVEQHGWSLLRAEAKLNVIGGGVVAQHEVVPVWLNPEVRPPGILWNGLFTDVIAQPSTHVKKCSYIWEQQNVVMELELHNLVGSSY